MSLYGDEAVIIINVDAEPRSVALPIVIESFDWIQRHIYAFSYSRVETILWIRFNYIWDRICKCKKISAIWYYSKKYTGTGSKTAGKNRKMEGLPKFLKYREIYYWPNTGPTSFASTQRRSNAGMQCNADAIPKCMFQYL